MTNDTEPTPTTAAPLDGAALAAVAMVRAGWPVVPIDPDEKRPPMLRGLPVRTGVQWREVWHTDPAEVLTFAAGYAAAHDGRPCRWAVITGVPRESDGAALVVLDTDDDDARLWLRGVLAGVPGAVGWAARTLRTSTERGRHLYGQVRGDDWPGMGDVIRHGGRALDVKAYGLAVLPGSPGRHVLWSDDADTGAVTLPAPQWMPPAVLDALGGGLADRWRTPRNPRAPRGALDGLAAGDRPWPRVLAALRAAGRRVDVRGAGDALVSCPGPSHAHGDRHPSLWLTDDPETGRVGAHCFAGCSLDQWAPAAGLTTGDLFALPLLCVSFVADDGATWARLCTDPEHQHDDPRDNTTTTTEGGHTMPASTTTERQAGGAELLAHAGSRPDSEGRDSADSGPGAGREPDDDRAGLLDAARARFSLLDRAAVDTLPPPREMVRGVLPGGPGALTVLAGGYGLGKTLTGIDLAGHVAGARGAGAVWHGHRVRETGPVLYVAREGFHGVLRLRVPAWETHHGARMDGVHWLGPAAPLDLRESGTARDLGLIAADLGAVLVVLDSAARTGAGKEDTDDMGRYVEGVRRVLAGAGCAGMVLHNTGWGDRSRPRGSTLLPDAADTVLVLSGDRNGVRALVHDKHRDGDAMEPLSLRFRSLVVGTDPDDGAPITSGVLVPVSAVDALTDRLAALLNDPKRAALGARLLSTMTSTPGQSGRALAEATGTDKTETAEVLRVLAAGGHAENRGTGNVGRWHAVPVDTTTETAADGAAGDDRDDA